MISRLVPLLGMLLIAASVRAQPIEFNWSRSFGDLLNDDGIAVAFDAEGNLLFMGAFRGTVDFGGGALTSAGGEDVFVVKLDPNGLFLWSRQFGGASDDFAAAVGVAGADIFLTGSFPGTVDFGGGPLTSAGSRDIFVVSLDSNGAHRWSRRFGGTSDDGAADLATAVGTVDIVGTFRGTVDFGGGPITSAPGITSGFVLRLDASGVYQWSAGILGFNEAGIVNNQSTQGVAVSPAGDSYVVGVFSDCEMLCFRGASLRKYSPQGALSWTKTELGHTDHNNTILRDPVMSDVAVGAGGMVFVGGRDFACPVPTQSCGAAVRCYSSAGTIVWERSFGGNSTLRGLYSTGDGDVMITGNFSGSVDFGNGPITSDNSSDIFVARLNDAFPFTYWSERIGGPASDVGADIVAMGEHDFALAGRFQGEAGVGTETHTSAGLFDALVVRANDEPPLAVAISEFGARVSENGVLLNARFQSNLGVTSIDVYRSTGAGEFQPARIASVHDAVADRFEFRDRDVLPGETYQYQIGVQDGDGTFMSDVATVSLPPRRAELLASRPNPFNPTTVIQLSLPAREQVTLVIFDTAGRRVRVLVDEVRPAGLHDIEWDGRDDVGTVVPSGVYFCRMQAGNAVDSEKLVLLK